MKNSLFLLLLFLNTTVFSSPLHEPSITAKIKVIGTNREQVEAEEYAVKRDNIERCEDEAKKLLFKKARVRHKRRCVKRVKGEYNLVVNERTVESVIAELSTSRKSDREEIKSILREEKYAVVYNTLLELREVARSSIVKTVVRDYEKLSNGIKVKFVLDVELYEGDSSSHKGHVFLSFGENKRRRVHSLFYRRDDGGQLIGAYSSLSLKDKILNLLDDKIHAIQEQNIKNDGLDGILDDFTSIV